MGLSVGVCFVGMFWVDGGVRVWATIEAKYWVILDICPGKFINFWNRCLAEKKLK